MIEYVFTYVTSRMGPPIGIMIAFFVSGAIVILPYAILDDKNHPVLSWLWVLVSTITVALTWMGVIEYYGGSV